jgi:hypothetical protein
VVYQSIYIVGECIYSNSLTIYSNILIIYSNSLIIYSNLYEVSYKGVSIIYTVETVHIQEHIGRLYPWQRVYHIGIFNNLR